MDTREHATTDTIYQIGSMTKTWTALAFMQLVDEGALDLDEPVRDYLPGFSVGDAEATATVTARHLLNHTNGIEEAFGDPGEDEDVYRRMVENIADAPQVFPVGHTHGYSAALGYAILGRILEVRDGRTWDDIMRDRLFLPMGLTSTSTRPDQVDRTRAAQGHLIRSLADGPFRTPMDHLPRAYGPGGNINSTIGEVLALAHVLLNEGVAANGKRIVSAGAHRRDDEITRADPGSVHVRPGMGARPDRVRLAGPNRVRERRQHDRPELPAARPAGLEHRDRDADQRRSSGEPSTAPCSTRSWPNSARSPSPNRPSPIRPATRPVQVRRRVRRPGNRYEVWAEQGALRLTHVRRPDARGDPRQAGPDHYELRPISETHFLMPYPRMRWRTPQTAAIYDFAGGKARYLHTNCRVIPRGPGPGEEVVDEVAGPVGGR